MGKSKRLIELMMVVNQKKRFTAGELAEEFGVSYRTMLRDLQELSELGVPLYAEPGLHGGYRIIKERVLPPIAFSENEAVALFFINESLRYYGGIPFEVERESILRKFHHYLPKDVKEKIDTLKDRVVFWNPVREQSSPILEDVLDAAIKQKPVMINYDSSNGISYRTVQFVGLYSYNGFWYCPGYCLEKDEFRLFRGDRILNVLQTDTASKDLSAFSLEDWLKEEEVEKHSNTLSLDVRLTVKGVRKFSSDLLFGDKIVLNEDGSGTLQTEIMKKHVEYCADLLFALGKEARVKTPVEVIEVIKEKIKQVLDLYVN